MNQRKVALACLCLFVGITSAAFADGPLRRLFKRNKSVQSQPVCQDGQCYTQPLLVAPPVVSTPIVLPPPSSPVVVGRTHVQEPIVAVAEKGFRRSLLRAINSARKQGSVTGRDALRLRIASFAPAFLKAAEDLCVTQMAFSSDAELLPVTETGDIDRTAIDWDAFAAFLERIIPLIVDLLMQFGVFG